MTILISEVGTLIQIRIGVGSATFPIMGPTRGQYVFLMTKIHIFYFYFFFFFFYFFIFFLLLILLFWVIGPHFIK